MDAETLKLLSLRFERQSKKAAEILEKDPRISPASAYVIAGDMVSAEDMEVMVENGSMSVRRAARHVGSYARLGFLCNQFLKDRLSPEWVLKEFPSEWCAADPDDTDPVFHSFWINAWSMNGCKPIKVGRGRMPKGRANAPFVYDIYRGQDEHDPFGLAWSLDVRIAEKFARTRGLRQANYPGVVFHGIVHYRDIYGYITARRESEIVADPAQIRIRKEDTYHV